MKQISQRLLPWLTLCLLTLLLLTGCVSAAPDKAPPSLLISIESGDGITLEETADFQQAARATTAYYQEQGLQLKKPVTLVLTRNRQAFLTESITRFKVSELEVHKAAKAVDALAGDHLIVFNVDGTPTTRQRVFILAHELTHQYQRELAGANADGVKWMLEGMAEAVGAQLVARAGFFSVPQYKANWQTGIAMSPQKPFLNELRTSSGWSNSLTTYGGPLTYKTAGLATLILLERYGTPKFLAYFRELNRGSTPEEAFRKAFDLDMGQFENEIAVLCRKAS